jgi:hypothetical protein
MPILSKKCTTQIGSPIPYFYTKRIRIGGSVLIILISTRHAKKIHSACPEIIKLWTPQPVAAFQVSLIITWAIIIFPSKKKTKSRHPSSIHSALFAT